MAIITLFSGSYCHAEEISSGVARELGYQSITDSLFKTTGARYDISPETLRKSLTGSSSLLDKFTNSRDKHLAHLRLGLAELIQTDGCMVEGCVGHLIPRTIGHLLKVCIIANRDYRIAQASADTGRSEKDAAGTIKDNDEANFACTDYLFGKAAYDESLYDLLLPMHDRMVDEAIAEICALAKSDAVAATDRSKRAARDFILSAQVGVKLAEEGLSADVHAESGQVVLSINKNVVRLNHYRETLTRVAEQVPGVTGVSTRLGPRYRPASANPWANIEGPKKIMLVDDEKDFVQTLSERLKTRHLESSIAYNGEEALAMADQETPEVIVLDLMMPGIDGIETLRRLKQNHPEVEVIILTGHGSEQEKRQAEDLGAFAYLRKPVDIDDLARVMREAYSQSAAGRSEQAEPRKRE